MQKSEDEKRKDQVEENKRKRRERIVEQLRAKVPVGDGPGCFLCKWILEDLEKNGALTGYPIDFNGGGVFPRAGKILHLQLEGMGAAG